MLHTDGPGDALHQQRRLPNSAVPSLPTAIRLHILSLLPRNQRVLSGRLVCRDSLLGFEGDPTASLAEPLPPHAAPWANAWTQGAGQVALREMPYDRKLHLLCTAAASGSEVNLEVVWTLLQPSILPELLQSRAVLFDADPGQAAARAGHAHVLGWLVQHCPAMLRPTGVLEVAAKHCSLAGLQAAWEALRGETAVFLPVITQWVLDAAAESATPDSIAKVDWVLATGPGRCGLKDSTVQAAARSGDVGLLRWLQGHGCALSSSTVLCALSHADLAVAQWLVDEAGCDLPAPGRGNKADDSADDDDSESDDSADDDDSESDGSADDDDSESDGSADDDDRESDDSGDDDDSESDDSGDDRVANDRRWVPYQYAALRSKDGLAKLGWLHERGCPLLDDQDTLRSKVLVAVEAGQEEAVRHLLPLMAARNAFQDGAGGEGTLDRLGAAAVAQGSIPLVQVLCNAGCVLASGSYGVAAQQGNVGMVRWLAREAGVSAADMDQRSVQMFVKAWLCRAADGGRGLPDGMLLLLEAGLPVPDADWGRDVMQRVLRTAAETGNLAAVQELLGPGGQVDVPTAILAVRGGCEALLEWLAGRPGGLNSLSVGSPYVDAMRHGDMGTVAVLRRLGVQWGERDSVEWAVWRDCGLPAVRWLVEQGAPVGSAEEMEGALRYAAPWFSGEEAGWLRGVAGAVA